MERFSSLTLEPATANLDAARMFVEQQAVAAGFSPERIAGLVQAVDEAVTNIIVHGYREERGTIVIEARSSGAGIRISLRDRAPLFDPTTVPVPNLEIPLRSRRPGGMGVHLMRELTDALSYRVTDAGENELTLELRA